MTKDEIQIKTKTNLTVHKGASNKKKVVNRPGGLYGPGGEVEGARALQLHRHPPVQRRHAVRYRVQLRVRSVEICPEERLDWEKACESFKGEKERSDLWKFVLKKIGLGKGM